MRLFFSLFVILVAAPAALANTDENYNYRYFKEYRQLTLKAHSIAAIADELSDPAALLGIEGLPVQAAAPKAIRGVWKLTLENPVEDIRAVLDAATAELRNTGIFLSPVFVDDLGGDLIPSRTILIGFDPVVPDERAKRVIRDSIRGAVIESPWPAAPRMYRVKTGLAHGLEVLEKANQLADREDVLFAEPDMMFSGSGGFTPNDPGYPLCWGHENTAQFGGIAGRDMDTDLAWDLTIGDANIRVMVIDTGVDMNHPDINLHPVGFDTTSDAGDGGPVNEFDNHGTPVAGCVSARINNGLGTVGTAPGCPVISARTFIAINSDGNWNSSASWTVAALQAAISEGARVTNNSNRYGFTSASISNMYSIARANGIVHFASAGNASAASSSYPASLSNVNAVAALDQSGFPTDFTNSDPDMAFSAPGIDVYTTDRTGSDGWSTGDYTFASGTSFASPYTAGVAALVLSSDPTLSPGDVEMILRQAALDLGNPGHDADYGYGFVNASVSVRTAVGCDGDCSGNFEVEFNDLICILIRFGQINHGSDTDCNLNGEVDFNDLVCALFNFGPCF